MKGVSAVIATILMLMITIALAGMAYMYITGVISTRTGVVIEMDESATTCTAAAGGGQIMVYVRNDGTLSTDASTITVSGTMSNGSAITDALADTPVTCGAATTALDPGAGSIPCAASFGSVGTNSVVVSGPSNTVRGSVYCATDSS